MSNTLNSGSLAGLSMNSTLLVQARKVNGQKLQLEFAEVLQKEGISVEIIDLRTVRPIDYKTVVDSIKKTNRCVVVEESWPLASISSEIAYHLQHYAFDYLDAPVYRVTQTDTPFAFSPTLIEAALPNVERIVAAVKASLYR